jgi:predicted ArsR family transcriptional regulator
MPEPEFFSASEILIKLNKPIHERALRRHLVNLKKSGLIDSKGTTKSTTYHVIKIV